nr:TFPI-2 [Sinocrossocheilus bamaensis]
MACDFLGRLLLIVAVLKSAVGVQPKEVCLLQIEEGTCNDDIQRYYYNTITQQCEEFSYSGCGGNANNFKSFMECQKTCFRIPKIPRICRFQKKEGHCRGLFMRYFFNMTSMQCETFTYGGCQGNENNFQNLQECMEYCRPPKTIPVICSDILDKGKCLASIPRYYYNSATKTCEEFIYTGCGGSNNNFISKKSCMDVCGKNGSKSWSPTKKSIRVSKEYLRRVKALPPREKSAK